MRVPTTLNRLWADLIIETLVRNGITRFCLAPGSRSTPLTTAVARHPKADSIMHFDERGTSFFALGHARATHKPAVWITTSGTAAANGLPAVVEASQNHVPMLLLTADRPPELRDTGANQAIDQVKLFGNYVRWQFDMPCPTPEIDPAFVLTTVEQALYRALHQPCGPVHLNCMFREPLAPESAPPHPEGYTTSIRSWFQDHRPYTRYEPFTPRLSSALTNSLVSQLATTENGLLVVGRLDTPDQIKAVQTLAQTLNRPVLPDVTSQLRLGPALPNAIYYYDQLLGSSDFCDAHAPQLVLHVGGPFVSKRLLKFLEHNRPEHYVRVKETPIRQDPTHSTTHHIESDLKTFCAELTDHLPPRLSSPWLRSWQSAQAEAATRLDSFFDASEELNEPAVARLIARYIPKGHGLYLGNSMPVRDMDMFAAPREAQTATVANRGASGIDGTVAGAAGFAVGRGTPVTLLIGDLALLHDLNSLALLRSVPVVIVAINNNGGGIFSFLPIARFESVFEPYFGTPHDLTFESAARMFGLTYAQPSTKTDFLDMYHKACRSGTSALIEVRTNREENVVLHQRLLELCKV